MDAFDADVLIYAAVAGHPLGSRIRALFAPEPGSRTGVGSVLLLPEILAKPMRDGCVEELTALASLLSRLELRALDAVTAEVATSLAATHRLRAADAVHLATAVVAGADRFLTNNRRDFPDTLTEIDVTYPDMLPDVAWPDAGGGTVMSSGPPLVVGTWRAESEGDAGAAGQPM